MSMLIYIVALLVACLLAWLLFVKVFSYETDSTDVNTKSGLSSFLLLLLPIFVLCGFAWMAQDRYKQVEQWEQTKEQWQPAIENYFKTGNEFANAEKLSLPDMMRLTQDYLQRNPQDDTAWYQAALLYMQAEQPTPAAQMMQRALDLKPDNVDYQISLAQSLVAVGSPEKVQEGIVILSKLLDKQPEHQMALLSLALAYDGIQAKHMALTTWKRLAEVQKVSRGEVMPLVAQKIAALSTSSDDEQPKVAPALNAETMKPQTMQAQQQASSVSTLATVNVNISDELRKRAKQGVLFVIIKEPVMPMPVAVHRIGNANFPLTLEFSDAQNLSPQRKLSELIKEKKPLEVLARYSFAGVAGKQAGDFYAEAQILTETSTNAINLTINQEVK